MTQTFQLTCRLPGFLVLCGLLGLFQPPSVMAEGPTSISASDLAKAFASNPKNAQKDYGKAVLTVKGRVEKVEGPNVTLATDSKIKVVMKLAKATDQTLLKTTIEATGTILEFKSGRVLLKAGDVKMEAESKDISADELAKAFTADPKKFEKEYTGLMVNVKGVVVKVQEDMVFLSKGIPAIILKSEKGAGKDLMNTDVTASGRIIVNQGTIMIGVKEIKKAP